MSPMVGCNVRKLRSNSSASTTITSPFPEIVLLRNLFTIPPITMVGFNSAAVNISPSMEQVEVFPWVPAIAMLVGFTGTPLLKMDKQKSIEVFGPYIHTYKYDEAVSDRVILHLRYEARKIPQELSSPEKVDLWFDAKTAGLNEVARAKLKKRWSTMQKIFSANY